MTTRSTCSVFVAAAVIFSCGGVLADNVEKEPRYLSVECMKSTSPEYQSIEIDVWLPMHQEMVEQRKQERWALYWVKYGDRSRCDYYTVTTYVGSAQLNAVPAFDEVFKVAHPRGDFTKAMVRTGASRQHVASELWQMVDAIPSNQHRFAIVNRMNAADPDAYERMETRVFKPGHEALVDGGLSRRLGDVRAGVATWIIDTLQLQHGRSRGQPGPGTDGRSHDVGEPGTRSGCLAGVVGPARTGEL